MSLNNFIYCPEAKIKNETNYEFVLEYLLLLLSLTSGNIPP